MIFKKARRKWYKLRANRIIPGVLPVDQTEQIRGHTHGHGGQVEALFGIFNKCWWSDTIEHLDEFFLLVERVFHLPFVVDEGLAIDVKHGSPELIIAQHAMFEF